MENITHRKRQSSHMFGSCGSMSDLEDNMSLTSLSGELNSSCPNIYIPQLDEYKRTILDLETKLESADNEIESLLLENGSLKEKVSNQGRKITQLMQICGSTAKRSESLSKRRSLCKEQLNYSQMETSQSFRELQTEQIQIYKSNSTQTDNTQLNGPIRQHSLLDLLEKISKIHSELADSEKLILTLTRQIEEMSHTFKLEERTTIETKAPHTLGKLFNAHPFQTTNIKNTPKNRKILIYGSQKCVGLATGLLQSRENSKYEKYEIFSETKPYADAFEILKSLKKMDIGKNDKVILGIGENDSNPKLFLSQLRCLFDRYKDVTILVLNVSENRYLNVNMLNREIQNICTMFNNVYYTHCKYYSLNRVYYSINNIIDTLDYDRKYLDVKQLKKLTVINRPVENTLHVENNVKGTIPYYFTRMKVNQNPPEIKCKKGTIPCYFPTIKKCKFFRDEGQ